MKIKDIRMVLRRHLGESFDSSKLAEYFEEYYVNHNLSFENADSIPFLNIKKLQAIIFILEKVRLCFSNEEFSKLVCMSIVRYSHIHGLVFMPRSKYAELSFTRFATPINPIPNEFESLEVTYSGFARINNRIERIY